MQRMHSRMAAAALAAICTTGTLGWAADGTFASATVTPETALAAAQAALESCRDRGYQVVVAVTDRGGAPIALLRDRYAGPYSVEAATRKAYTAANFNMDSGEIAAATQAGAATSGIRMVSGLLALGGGLPLQAAGSLVGAIGVSGAPSPEADKVCAQAGIDAIEADLEF